jgi:hypothetical protein
MGHFLRFRRADLIAHGIRDDKLDLFSHLEERIQGIMRRPFAGKRGDLAIDGHRVMQILELKPGPRVGQVLGMLFEKVTDEPGLNREEKLVALLRQMKTERD